jgi:hypothetical protein
MAHYALLNADNIVMKVITGNNENDDRLPSEFSSWEEFYADQQGYDDCKRTSYNTKHNQHLNGGTPFRGNHAGVGYTYDTVNDVFIPEQPHDMPDSTWDLSSCKWVDPE